MALKDLTKEEIELLSYTDLTYMLLKEKGKPMTTADIFKEICNILEYSDNYYTEAIGDYYTSLTIDKRFIWLDSKEWDLRDNHSVNLLLDDDDLYEEEEIEELEDEEEIEEMEENFEEEIDEVDDLEDNDELDDLNIVDDEELDNV